MVLFSSSRLACAVGGQAMLLALLACATGDRKTPFFCHFFVENRACYWQKITKHHELSWIFIEFSLVFMILRRKSCVLLVKNTWKYMKNHEKSCGTTSVASSADLFFTIFHDFSRFFHGFSRFFPVFPPLFLTWSLAIMSLYVAKPASSSVSVRDCRI